MSYNQPPPPPGYGGQEGYGGAAPQPTSKKAVWSLVSGIGAILCGCLGIIFGPLAIVLSNQSKKDPGGGGGLATAGLVLGIIGSVLGLISLALLATGNFYFEVN